MRAEAWNCRRVLGHFCDCVGVVVRLGHRHLKDWLRVKGAIGEVAVVGMALARLAAVVVGGKEAARAVALVVKGWRHRRRRRGRRPGRRWCSGRRGVVAAQQLEVHETVLVDEGPRAHAVHVGRALRVVIFAKVVDEAELGGREIAPVKRARDGHVLRAVGGNVDARVRCGRLARGAFRGGRAVVRNLVHAVVIYEWHAVHGFVVAHGWPVAPPPWPVGGGPVHVHVDDAVPPGMAGPDRHEIRAVGVLSPIACAKPAGLMADVDGYDRSRDLHRRQGRRRRAHAVWPRHKWRRRWGEGWRRRRGRRGRRRRRRAWRKGDHLFLKRVGAAFTQRDGAQGLLKLSHRGVQRREHLRALLLGRRQRRDAVADACPGLGRVVAPGWPLGPRVHVDRKRERR